MKNELWKSVSGYEGYYEISSIGRIKSLARVITRSDGQTRLITEKFLTPVKHNDGYLSIKLCKNGHCKTVRIHRLVAEAFIPNPQNLPEVNHKDMDRSNNNVTNLEWTTHLANVAYSASKGKYQRFGVRNSNYRNDTLKNFYALHPEERIKLSRPGSQNGRARKISVVFPDGTSKQFAYIGACAEYLQENGWVKSRSINAIRNRISLAIKNDSSYCKLYFFDL